MAPHNHGSCCSECSWRRVLFCLCPFVPIPRIKSACRRERNNGFMVSSSWQFGQVSFWFRWRWGLRPHISGEAFPSVYGSISCAGLLLRWLLPSVRTLFFKEGAVCLLIGFPILFVCGFAGVLVGRLLFKSKTAAMNLSVIPVLLIATLAEGRLRQDQQGVVEDRLLINAPATAVWNYVVSFPTIGVGP